MMGDKDKSFVSAVIYVHNARERIECFMHMIIRVFEENFESSEIICVNDCSDDDGVLSCIREVSKSAVNTNITILNMSYYHGVEMAMNAGVDLAIGDFVFEFDSTILDYDESEIMRIYKKAVEGYDIVSASPKRKQRMSSRIFYYIFHKFTNPSYKLYTERFRILSRRVINRIQNINKVIPYRKAAYVNCGLKTENLTYLTRDVGKNCDVDKKEKRYRKHLAVDTLILYTDIGYRFSIAMTVLMMAVTILVITYSIVVYLFYEPIAGWTTTILFLAVAFFGLFGILTIIIKYLQILVDLLFRRKHYNFESVEKLTK